jgi:DNA polymerase-3 subunit alpha
LRNEKELLGFYVTGHPLMKHYEIIEKYCTANSSNLGAKSPGAVVRFAGMTKNVKEHTTKKGERMAFIEIEDLDGAVEATVFADLYVIHKELLQSGDPIVLIGTREGEGETPKLLAQDIVRIEETPRKFGRNVTIRFSTPGVDAEKIKALRKILIRHRGQIPVRVHVVIPNRTETIIGLDAFGCDPTQGFVADVHNTFGPDAIEIK